MAMGSGVNDPTDQGKELPTPQGPAYAPPVADGPADPVVSGDTTDWPPKRPRPRLLVPLGIVAIILVAGVIVFAATRGEDDTTSSSSSTLVRYDVNADKVDLLDADGKVTKTFDGPGDDNETMSAGPKGTVVFDGDKRFAVMDITDGSVTSYDIPDGFTLDTRLEADTKRMEFVNGVGDDVLVIDIGSNEVTSARDVIGISDAGFVPGRAYDGAQTFFDATSDQPRTLVVPQTGDMWIVPGNVLDVDGDRTLVASIGDTATTISVYDRDKKVDAASVDKKVLGGVLTGDHAALVIGLDGSMATVDVKGGTTKAAGSVTGDPGYVIPLTHDRLFVVGYQDTSYLIDGNGKTVASFAAADDGTGDPEAVALGIEGFLPGARCFLTRPGGGVTLNGAVDVRTIADGKSVGQLSTTGVLAATPDGCSAVGLSGNSADVVLDGKAKDLGKDASVTALAPDLEHAVISGGDGFQLVDIGSGTTTDLDRGLYAFAPN
ncbi:MAG: hypothetical protein JWM34_1762 [Ilumatobacteraceae bacterium]|nr:hypothetical protein [Ilumatobacteraceae bacterium]